MRRESRCASAQVLGRGFRALPRRGGDGRGHRVSGCDQEHEYVMYGAENREAGSFTCSRESVLAAFARVAVDGAGLAAAPNCEAFGRDREEFCEVFVWPEPVL